MGVLGREEEGGEGREGIYVHCVLGLGLGLGLYIGF